MKKIFCLMCLAILPLALFAKGKKDLDENTDTLPPPEKIGPAEGAGIGGKNFIDELEKEEPRQIPVAEMKPLEKEEEKE